MDDRGAKRAPLAAMSTPTALLAVVLLVSVAPLLASGVSPAGDRVRYATAAEWAACIAQAQAELAPQGKCGASNCYDDAGRDLIDICVAEVGYLRHTAAETAELLRQIEEEGISNVTASIVRTYPPGHPVHEAYTTAQAIR
jgi:hypothetical protein